MTEATRTTPPADAAPSTVDWHAYKNAPREDDDFDHEDEGTAVAGEPPPAAASAAWQSSTIADPEILQLIVLRAEARRQRGGNPDVVTAQAEQDGHPIPTMPGTGLEPADWHPFPTDVWHRDLAALCMSIGRATASSATIPLVQLSAAVGAAIGNSRHVAAASFVTNSSLWTTLIAPSGSSKSVSRRELTSPLVRWQVEHEQTRQQAIASHKQQQAAAKAAARNAKATAAAVVAQTKAMLPPTAVIPIVTPPTPPGGDDWEPPPHEIFHATSATTEGLARAMRNNPRGLMFDPDEINSWLGGLDLYRPNGRGTDLEFFCRTWDGERDCTLRGDREEPIRVVLRPFLTVTGGLQTLRLDKIAGNDDYGASGFLARLDMFTVPQEFIEWRADKVDVGLLDVYCRAMRLMLELNMTVGNDNELRPGIIELDAGALARFIAVYNDNNRRKLQETEPAVTATWPKKTTKILRWALLLHVSDWAVNSVIANKPLSLGTLIDLPTLERAIMAADWLHERTLAIYADHFNPHPVSGQLEDVWAYVSVASAVAAADPAGAAWPGLTSSDLVAAGVVGSDRQARRLLERLEERTLVQRTPGGPRSGKGRVSDHWRAVQ